MVDSTKQPELVLPFQRAKSNCLPAAFAPGPTPSQMHMLAALQPDITYVCSDSLMCNHPDQCCSFVHNTICIRRSPWRRHLGEEMTICLLHASQPMLEAWLH